VAFAADGGEPELGAHLRYRRREAVQHPAEPEKCTSFSGCASGAADGCGTLSGGEQMPPSAGHQWPGRNALLDEPSMGPAPLVAGDLRRHRWPELRTRTTILWLANAAARR
jgi:ABC-type branched-subunit amino acid transport system ATPase component